MNKAPDAFRTISEVADELDLPQHVLRFWESRFPHIRPLKRGGGRRYYRPEDVDLLRGIRHLLYGDGYTIRGVQRILREQGVRTVQSVGQGRAVNLPAPSQGDARADGEAEGSPDGAGGVLKFLPRFSGGAEADVEEPGDIEEHEEEATALDEPSQREHVRPKLPKPDVKGPVAPPIAKEPGVPQVPRSSQAAPSVAAPAKKGLAPEELERLKHALSELEACRRLLDKANEDP